MYEYLGGQVGGTETYTFKKFLQKYTRKGIQKGNVSVLQCLGGCQMVQKKGQFTNMFKNTIGIGGWVSKTG